MGLYDKYVLPKIINWACKQKPTRRQREKIIPLAAGNVLEIGIGSGLNLPFYNPDKINHLTAIDPSKQIWNKNIIDTNELPFAFEFIEAYAENIPVDSNSIDSVVFTYTLCSIPDTIKALSEVRRVLKPTGKLIFCEHGKAPDSAVQRWQNIVNPIWGKVGGGCSLTKDIPAELTDNGFKLSALETMYIPGWKPVSFNYWGIAEPR